MISISQIVFIFILAILSYFIVNRIRKIRSNILLGRDLDRNDNFFLRIKKMMLVAFGQQKMFKKPLPAFLHALVYVGFLVINLEVLEFVIDGLFGTHRIFAPYLGSAYSIAMNVFEFLAIAVIVSCLIFLIRRNVLKVNRLKKIFLLF